MRVLEALVGKRDPRGGAYQFLRGTTRMSTRLFAAAEWMRESRASRGQSIRQEQPMVTAVIPRRLFIFNA